MRRDAAPDVIRWVLDRMMAHHRSITPELALVVEREARARWGGRRVEYVAKSCQAERDARHACITRTRPW